MEKRNQNNQQSQKDLKYINVPLSIVKKRWFKGENAVRAWFFYAWNALMSRYDADVMVKGQTFHLTEGETYMHTKLSFRVFGYQGFYGEK